MAVSIISSTLGASGKILRKSTRSTSVDGLVTLVENYTIRTADIATLEPDAGTTHASFSSNPTKYVRMLVETTATNPMDGELTELVVTYVGLDYASGLPKAYITAVGQPGVGIFGADAAVVVKYITQDSLFDTLKGGNVGLNLGSTNLTLPTKRLMPTAINGTSMPPNPRQREYRRSKNISEVQSIATAQYNSYLKANPVGPGGIVQPPVIFYAPQNEWIYAGYVQTSISFQRRGLFNQIEEQFTEYFKGTDIFYQTDGTINFSRVNSFSDVNYTF
ncbi:MAG: hypothetical protein EBR82_52740 [Caulobacteraceae bacterium]|nr:hypothetical protein [Caulobacteraceae bacterium]